MGDCQTSAISVIDILAPITTTCCPSRKSGILRTSSTTATASAATKRIAAFIKKSNTVRTRINGMLMLNNIELLSKKIRIKERTGNKERLCAHQFVPYCEFRLYFQERKGSVCFFRCLSCAVKKCALIQLLIKEM